LKEFRPTGRHALIARNLLQGKPVRETARLMNQNPGTLLRTIKRMEKNGYLKKDFRSFKNQYSLTLLGHSLLELLKDENPKGNTTENSLTGSVIRATATEKSPKFFRLHALQFKIPLVEAFPAESIHLVQFKDHGTRLRNLNNHADLIIEFQDFNVTLTTRAVKITGIEVRLPYEEVEDPSILLEKARDIFMPEVLNIEMLLQKHFPKLRLKRFSKNVLDVEVIKGELALENDELAIKVGDIQKKTKNKLLVNDLEDGKPAMTVDFSKGPPEIETIHSKKFIDHMQIYKGWLEDLISGKFYTMIHDLVESQKQSIQIQKKQEEIQASAFAQVDERLGEQLRLMNTMATQFYTSLNEFRQAIQEVLRK
jgi:DNA-binding MarR family transcriptional regulator